MKASWEVALYGGPWSANEVESMINEIPLSDHCKPLLAQISFHRDVVCSRGPRTLFQESSRGKTYDTGQLKENLIELLHLNGDNNIPAPAQGLSYRQTQDIEDVIQSKRTTLLIKLESARKSRQADKSKSSLKSFL